MCTWKKFIHNATSKVVPNWIDLLMIHSSMMWPKEVGLGLAKITFYYMEKEGIPERVQMGSWVFIIKHRNGSDVKLDHWNTYFVVILFTTMVIMIQMHHYVFNAILQIVKFRLNIVQHVVRSLQSRMGLCYCPGTTMTTSPKSCSFAHWRRPFL